jgi:hypothetical protein
VSGLFLVFQRKEKTLILLVPCRKLLLIWCGIVILDDLLITYAPLLLAKTALHADEAG